MIPPPSTTCIPKTRCKSSTGLYASRCPILVTRHHDCQRPRLTESPTTKQAFRRGLCVPSHAERRSSNADRFQLTPTAFASIKRQGGCSLKPVPNTIFGVFAECARIDWKQSHRIASSLCWPSSRKVPKGRFESVLPRPSMLCMGDTEHELFLNYFLSIQETLLAHFFSLPMGWPITLNRSRPIATRTSIVG